VELAYWLKTEAKNRKKALFFAFRSKKDTYIKKGKSKEYPFKNLNLQPGVKIFLTGVKVTKKKGFGQFNIAAYHRRKYRGKRPEEPWYILTNLDTVDETLKIYAQRTGIEAMFKDCKTGGYNLEGSKANSERLTRIILLIAFVYTLTSLKGNIIKNQGVQVYIGRLKDKKRTRRRHSSFWIGLYGDAWTISENLCLEYVSKIKEINRNKLLYYQKGEKAMSLIKSLIPHGSLLA